MFASVSRTTINNKMPPKGGTYATGPPKPGGRQSRQKRPAGPRRPPGATSPGRAPQGEDPPPAGGDPRGERPPERGAGPRAGRPSQRARDEASGAAKRQAKPERPRAQPPTAGAGQTAAKGRTEARSTAEARTEGPGNRGRVRAARQSRERPRDPDPGPIGCGPAGPRTPAKPGSWAKPSRAAKRPRPPEISGGRPGGYYDPPQGCLVPRDELGPPFVALVLTRYRLGVILFAGVMICQKLKKSRLRWLQVPWKSWMSFAKRRA